MEERSKAYLDSYLDTLSVDVASQYTPLVQTITAPTNTTPTYARN